METLGGIRKHIREVLSKVSTARNIKALHIKMFYDIQQIKHIIAVQLLA